jgi:hypothetical protein
MTPPVPDNPYESPRVVDQAVDKPRAGHRAAAVKHVRDALCILAIPALWNYGCLFWGNFVGLPPSGQALAASAAPGHGILAMANLVVLVASFLAGWFLAMTILDWVALTIHFWWGGTTPARDWLQSMYHSLWTLVWASRLGAICWIAWLLLFFYSTNFDRFWISFWMGTLGHLIGAWVYGTILLNWYRLRRAVEIEK